MVGVNYLTLITTLGTKHNIIIYVLKNRRVFISKTTAASDRSHSNQAVTKETNLANFITIATVANV